MTGIILDWRKHTVGPLLPCRHCGASAICRDELGAPCHKVCAEAALSPRDNTPREGIHR
jgi:hypothetical protein